MGAAAIIVATAVLTAPLPVPRPGPAPADQPVQHALDRAVDEALAKVARAEAAKDAEAAAKPAVDTATLADAALAEPPGDAAPVLDLTMPLPPRRPERLAMAAAARSIGPQAAPNLRINEMVCRDPRLRGNPKPTVIGHIPGCAIVDPVSVTEIAGIKLSSPATLNCRTAKAFANWVTGVAAPAAREILGRRLTHVTIYGTYSCRTRNNRPGARLSEHAVGRAIDVAGVTLGDGRKISVLKDWGQGHAGQFLRRIWKQACGPFKTVIGPEGDRYHRDHLHLDTALRKRSYCR